MIATRETTTIPYGDLLKKYRMYQGFTQPQLAHVAGVSVNHISGIERGNTNPSVDVLKRLAAALGVSTSHLLGEVPFLATWPIGD